MIMMQPDLKILYQFLKFPARLVAGVGTPRKSTLFSLLLLLPMLPMLLLMLNLVCFQAAAVETGNEIMKFYFHPDDQLEDQVAGYILSATHSVWMATETIASKKIRDALVKAHDRRLDIRIVVPKITEPMVAELSDRGIRIVEAENPAGFCHNFIIRDLLWTMISSGKFESLELNSRFNYLMEVKHRDFSENFIVEYDEMFLAGNFGENSLRNTPRPEVQLGDHRLTVRFVPEDSPAELLILALNRIQSILYASISELPQNYPFSLISQQAALGKDIKLLVTIPASGFINDYPPLKEVNQQGADVIPFSHTPVIRDGFWIVDSDKLLLTPGKVNLYDNADGVAIYIEGSGAALRFTEKFNQRLRSITAPYNIRGQVKNSVDASPLGGVKVNASSSHLTYTDENGWYTISGLSGSGITIFYEKPGYYTASRKVDLVEFWRQDVLLRPISGGGKISGWVVSGPEGQAQPVHEAQIQVQQFGNADGEITEISTTSNEAGFFQLDRIPAGPLKLLITRANFTEYRRTDLELESAETIDLGRVFIQPRYQVAFYPNPIFAGNFQVSVLDRSAAAELPPLTIAQSGLEPIRVPTSRIIFHQDYSVFQGSYKVISGYWGRATITVEGTGYSGHFDLSLLDVNRSARLSLDQLQVEVFSSAVQSSQVVSLYPLPYNAPAAATAAAAGRDEALTPAEGWPSKAVAGYGISGRNLSGRILLPPGYYPVGGDSQPFRQLRRDSATTDSATADSATADGRDYREFELQSPEFYLCSDQSAPKLTAIYRLSSGRILIQLEAKNSGLGEFPLNLPAGTYSVSRGKTALDSGQYQLVLNLTALEILNQSETQLEIFNRAGNRLPISRQQLLAAETPGDEFNPGNNQPAGETFKVIPAASPVSGWIELEITTTFGGQLELDFYNAAGRRIESLGPLTLAAGRDSVTIPCGRWTNGVYLYRARLRPTGGDRPLRLTGKVAVLN